MRGLNVVASALLLALAFLVSSQASADAPRAPCTAPKAARARSLPRSARHTPLRAVISQPVLVTASDFNYLFSPQHVVVALGTQVTWTNRTAEHHTITDVSGKLFDTVVPGWKSVTLRFDSPGMYRYFCRFHPYMRGVIEVRPR